MTKSAKHPPHDDIDPTDDQPADHGMADPADDVLILKAQIEKLTDLAARSQAELQNVKIRMEREFRDLRQFALASFLMKLLPTIDNFQRAFQHLPEDLKSHEWVKGITAIEQDLMKRLTESGLTRIEAVGASVDPEKHEVLLEVPGEKGIVLEVLEDGYELHGKVLRPAKVKVGNGEV